MSYLVTKQHLQMIQQSATGQTGSVCCAALCMSDLAAAKMPLVVHIMGSFQHCKTSVCVCVYRGGCELEKLRAAVGCPLADTWHHFSCPVCGVQCQCGGIMPLSLRNTSAQG